MTSPRTRKPRAVKSFSPYFLGVYKQAALAPVEIPCDSRREAMALRAQLNNLRTSLRSEDHPLYEVAARCTNYLRGDDESGWCVVSAPADVFHEERIKAAGIEPFGGLGTRDRK